MAGSGRESKRRTNRNTRNIDACLILSGDSVLRVLCGFFTRVPRKEQDASVGGVLLEAFDW